MRILYLLVLLYYIVLWVCYGIVLDAFKFVHLSAQNNDVHRESKKGDTILLSISLLNIDRFS